MLKPSLFSNYKVMLHLSCLRVNWIEILTTGKVTWCGAFFLLFDVSHMHNNDICIAGIFTYQQHLRNNINCHMVGRGTSEIILRWWSDVPRGALALAPRGTSDHQQALISDVPLPAMWQCFYLPHMANDVAIPYWLK